MSCESGLFVQVSVYCVCMISAHLRYPVFNPVSLMDICFLTCICLWPACLKTVNGVFIAGRCRHNLHSSLYPL